MSVEAARTARTSLLERYAGVFAGVALVAVLFLPLIAIDAHGASLTGIERPGAGETTVGIAVILRATARRLLRGASTNLMRTTAGALGRTSARAATRRFVKFAGRLFFGSVVNQSAAASRTGTAPITTGSQVFALALGYVALALSFRGIMYVVPENVVADLTRSTGLGVLELVLLSGLPLLAYAGLHRAIGPRVGVKTRYRTELDGLLLQAYFTGAGSFLPLTTDVDFEGDALAKKRLATWSILGLFGLHGLSTVLGNSLGSPHLAFLGSMMLVYCFVYCFPIRPLEGHFIWTSSKVQWFAVTLPILIAFLLWLPPTFGEIL